MIGMPLHPPTHTQRLQRIAALAAVYDLSAGRVTKAQELYLLDEVQFQERIQNVNTALEGLSCPRRPRDGQWSSDYDRELEEFRSDHRWLSALKAQELFCFYEPLGSEFGERDDKDPEWWLSAPGVSLGTMDAPTQGPQLRRKPRKDSLHA
ncbi:hypothetical protein IT575_12200 [bacterium]|nr:hypothetical protein [bacterium]